MGDRGRAVHEDEILGALGGKELEAARELVPVRGHGGGREVDAAEGVRVPGEGVGHDGRDAGGGGVGGEQVGIDEDERRRAQDAGPALGERGGSCGVRGREAATATGPREGGGVPGGMQPRRRAVEGLSRRGAVLRRQEGGGE